MDSWLVLPRWRKPKPLLSQLTLLSVLGLSHCSLIGCAKQPLEPPAIDPPESNWQLSAAVPNQTGSPPPIHPASTNAPAMQATASTSGSYASRAADADNAKRLEDVRKDAFEQGRKVGEAEAAAKHFERGLTIGKEQGRGEGKTEASEANRLATKLAVNEAVANAELIGRLRATEELRKDERIQALTTSHVPAYFFCAVLGACLFFVLARRDVSLLQRADVHAAQYRSFIYQIFGLFEDRDRRTFEALDRSLNLPPPIDTSLSKEINGDRFRFGGGK